MDALIPAPYRWLAVFILAVAAFGFGWVKGAGHVQVEFNEFRVKVATAGQAQTAKTASAIQNQKSITTHSEAAYAQGNPALRDLYGPGRVRNPGAGGRSVPVVSAAAHVADASAADAGPSAQLPASGEDLCAGLRSDAAVTTRLLLFLQDWVQQQAVVSDSN